MTRGKRRAGSPGCTHRGSPGVQDRRWANVEAQYGRERRARGEHRDTVGRRQRNACTHLSLGQRGKRDLVERESSSHTGELG